MEPVLLRNVKYYKRRFKREIRNKCFDSHFSEEIV